MSDWYYAKDNQQMGPKNESEVKASIATGEIPADTLVWKDGMDGWMPANQVPAFSFRPPPAPAKVQPAAAVTPAPVVTSSVTPAAATTTTTATPSTFQTAPAASPTTATTTTTTAVPAKPIDVSAQMQNALGSIASLNTGVGIAGDPADVAQNKILSFLSYLGILFLVPLIAAGTSPFAKYHTNQGLILCLAFLAVFVPFSIILTVLAWILPSFLTGLISLLYLVLMIGYLVMIVLGLMNVNNGVMKPLPFIGSLFVIIK